MSVGGATPQRRLCRLAVGTARISTGHHSLSDKRRRQLEAPNDVTAESSTVQTIDDTMKQ